MTLLRSIDAFLKRTRMPPTRFGRLSVNDPRLVRDLRHGREPRRATIARIESFMQEHRP